MEEKEKSKYKGNLYNRAGQQIAEAIKEAKARKEAEKKEEKTKDTSVQDAAANIDAAIKKAIYKALDELEAKFPAPEGDNNVKKAIDWAINDWTQAREKRRKAKEARKKD